MNENYHTTPGVAPGGIANSMCIGMCLASGAAVAFGAVMGWW